MICTLIPLGARWILPAAALAAAEVCTAASAHALERHAHVLNNMCVIVS